ncbi:MAG: hypothetical protein A2845_04560 [Candidatus Lloydbacteria bacterium RIFCSPHIGHO2_01_FULL_49_22]|uniref:Uncharacterized protein n=1 Tax=Candidatus Lloydbacteria bacterium RIFCSPHIGHO2_01_FULL_49_22 TaxID=1798658 RepID=A0A1G2CW54_9BACT|nr:MAG: hypothetical protein A2845_04560 [Candidatus Lloydbacteria bacterium RIFCSPHIGHO2_01_FULL_49_22]OGZ10089.1 MAG: hypothetical protein A3C14_00595 [Candidatus Lloydbacteria bacterium RIFCSPHIGHO2_02_FULL_50_18]
MTKMIYGVDADAELSPVQVRDALVTCFREAHCDILDETFGSSTLRPEDTESLKKMDVELLIQEFFRKVEGDYDHPTKETLLLVMGELKKFAEEFRVEEIVSRHYSEILVLIKKLV